MNNVIDFVKTHGHLIAACIAGTCALTAAYIRRDRRWEKSESKVPFIGLLLGPLLSIIIGGVCLSLEYTTFPIEPKSKDPGLVIDTGADNGTMLVWVGCVLIAAGLLWLPYNIYRIATWPRPPKPEEEFDPQDEIVEDEAPPASAPVASASLARSGSVKSTSSRPSPGSTPTKPGSVKPGSGKPGSVKPGAPKSTPTQPRVQRPRPDPNA